MEGQRDCLGRGTTKTRQGRKTASRGDGRSDSSLSAQTVLELGDVDHEEAGEERGLPPLCRCQPLFPEPAGIAQQGVDEAAKRVMGADLGPDSLLVGLAQL